MFSRSTFFATLLAIGSIAPVFADVTTEVTQEAPSKIAQLWSTLGGLGNIAKITAATTVGLAGGIAIVAAGQCFQDEFDQQAALEILKTCTGIGFTTGCCVTFLEGVTDSANDCPRKLAHTERMKTLELKELELKTVSSYKK